MRQAVELVVHNRRQPSERALVAVGPRTEQRADVVAKRFTCADALRHGSCRGIISAFSVSSTDSSSRVSTPISVEPAEPMAGPKSDLYEKEHTHVDHKNPVDTAAD